MPNNLVNRPRKRLGTLLLLLAVLMLAGCKEELYGNLSENDANDIIAILLSNGLDSEKIVGAKGAYAIHVDRDQIAEAVQLLKGYGYPKEKAKSFGDVFSKDGIISSPLEERSRFIYALSQSIQAMLSDIDGVLSAHVNVVLPDNNPFAETLTPSSAAVTIKYHPDSGVEDYKSEIKKIVSKSIEGLSYDKVALEMFPARTPPQASLPIPWERALGLKLTSDSVGGFWLLIGSMLLLLVAAAGTSVYLFLQLRELRRNPTGTVEPDVPTTATANTFSVDKILKTVTG